MKVTPEIQEKLNEIELDVNHSTESTFLDGMKYQKNNSMPPSLVAVSTVAISLFLVAMYLMYIDQYTFTCDYKSHLKSDLFDKWTNMNDSAMRNVNTPKIYNRFIDSANKYYEIQHYIIIHK